jgi:Ca2+-binding EF-hand superfamily protein
MPNYVLSPVQLIIQAVAVEIAKGLSFHDIFSELDVKSNTAISLTQLCDLLIKLPLLKGFSTEDYKYIFKKLDNSESGIISLSQFLEFVSKQVDKERERDVLISTACWEQKLRKMLLEAVNEKGLTVSDLFNFFDKSKSGKLTTVNFAEGLKKLPHFRDVADIEISKLINCLFKTEDDNISKSYFESFMSTQAMSKNSMNAPNMINTDEKDDISVTHEAEIVQQLLRAAKFDGGIDALLAFLDNDGDGLIDIKSIMRFLRRENVFEFISEEETRKYLEKYGKINYRDEVSAPHLLRAIEGRTSFNIDNLVSYEHKHELENEELMEESKKSIVDEYEYSRDPELHALEKRMRSIGHILAKKGTDVEAIFKSYDHQETGLIRRTDFIAALSQLGLYLMERGKALNAAENEPSDLRKQQMLQVKLLKEQTASMYTDPYRFARKLIMAEYDDDQRLKTEFKVS